jgi:metal-responsive CopG/Arc/MetJ family transcriptional regulator
MQKVCYNGLMKITRSFTIEEEMFKQFKSILALKGYTSASKIIESLISKFIAKPEDFKVNDKINL